MLHGDFETRSKYDLIKGGGYNYAMDPSTQATMFAFAFDDEDPQIWIPLQGHFWDRLRKAIADLGHKVHKDFPKRILKHIKHGGMIAAHNAAFERLIFQYVVCPDFDIPEIPIEQFYCTATQARCNNMPAQLGDCAKALGAAEQKDKRGKELIGILCVPHDGEFIEDLGLYIEFALYCLQDVRTERSISKTMRPMTDNELDEYLASEIINDKGLMIDRELAAAAVDYADDEQADLIEAIADATDGVVTKARGKKLTQWVYERIPESAKPHMHKYKDGECRLTLDRNARERLLLDESVMGAVRDVIEYSDFAQASSTGKFKAMLERADPEDDRVRGAYVFNGAASTGRYSSRGLQTHNFPRDGLKDPDKVADMLCDAFDVQDIELAAGHSLMQTLKRLLRHSIIAAPGHTFVCGDWGQIEGRALPWLSMGTGPTDVFAQQKLDAYANQTHENDVYCQTASAVYKHTVIRDGSKEMDFERQIGKVAELSLGFGGGVGAFQGMAANYGVSIADDEADRIKTEWRKANPWAQPFWYALHKAAVNAVRNPGNVYHAGRIQYYFQPSVLMGCLWCLLPCGRVIAYPKARVEAVEGRYGVQWELSSLKSNWKPKADEKEWPRVNLWYGLLAENVDQGFCASLLRHLLTRLVLDFDAPVSGHTHDEALLEPRVEEADYWKNLLNDTMLEGHPSAQGLPLAVDIWVGPNFRK